MEEITHFAPALRSTSEQINKEYKHIASNKLFKELFGAISGISAVLDSNRQIVYANEGLLAMLDNESLDAILGNRLGEAISCVNSNEMPNGCGTSKACAYCGLVNAFLDSQRTGLKSVSECRISATADEKLLSFDLSITVIPLYLSENLYYVISIQDISNEKRRLALEKIFFHDILNSAGGLNGLLTILKEGCSPEETYELIDLSEEASRDVLEEIILHKQIKAAENGDLKVNLELINIKDIIHSSIGKIKSHEACRDKTVTISDDTSETIFKTDRILLQRIMINMIKNALESTKKNGFITVGATDNGNTIRFWVKNSEVMPIDVQMQMFQRSFSTKGYNRGIGTYSIKLLTENYLNGKVGFASNDTERTIFWVEFIKEP
ncbi:MAG: ATP-binding protein [Bacteroidales bacterium]|nr:ATP-binding protein [Bacteroidales bacterium]